MPRYWKISHELTREKTAAICDNFKEFALEKQKRARKNTFYLTTISENDLISEQQRKYYFKFIVGEWAVPFFQQHVDKPVNNLTAHYTLKWSKKLNLWDSAWDKIEEGLDGSKNIVRSITNLTVPQMSEFINKCVLCATERGFHIPEPYEADYDNYYLLGN